MRVLVLGLIWLAAGWMPSWGQEAPLRFGHLTPTEGLSQEDIHVILQDSLGFLWFGTEDGLNRYDGHALRVFRPTPFDTASLGGAWVVGLADDGAGGLWVATETEGLNRYDPRRETFDHLSRGAATSGLLGSHNLWVLLRARDGTLWLGARTEGLTRLDPATGVATTFRHDPSDPEGLSDDNIQALVEDEDGGIWVGTMRGGLDRFDPRTETFAPYRRAPERLPHDDVRALMIDGGGTLWIGTAGGLARYDRATDTFTVFRHDPRDRRSLGSDDVRALLETPDGALWVGTGQGLDRLTPASGDVTRYRHDPTEPASLGPGAVRTLYLDRSGVLWVGMESGLSWFAWSAPRFPVVTHDPAESSGLSDPGVWSFHQDRDSTLWVGTEAGLDRFDPLTGAVTHYRHDPADPATITPGWVVSLFEDSEGTFWVGTRRDGARAGGLSRFDRATGTVAERFVEDPADPTSLKSDNPWQLFEDSQNRLWVLSGGTGCLNLMDRAAGTFAPFCHDPGDPNTPSYDVAKEVVEDPAGVLWLATWGGGLDRFDTRTGVWTHYRHDPDDLNTPAEDYILSVFNDAQGVLWLGTYGGGLDRFDPATETFTHFTEATSGLPNDVVYAIEGDDDGRLWISTNRGLTRFDPATGRFRTFGLQNGLQDLEFNAVASYRASSGELFFGGIRGFNRFFPGRIIDDPAPPPVVLTRLRIRGVPVEVGDGSPLQQALPFTRELRLRAEQHDFALTFAALDFTNPAGNRFRYRLEGYDEAWYESGPERTATFTNLDPGRYTVRVQATTSASAWSKAGATLALVVAPPWWATWWAYAGYALLALGLGTALYRARRARHEERHRREEEQHRIEIERIEAQKLRQLDHARSRFFANVSHEFRTPLTLTIGPLDDVQAGLYGPLAPEVATQLALARRNAGRVLDLINQILDVARLEAGRMRLRARRLDLGAFVADTAQAFVPLAERRGITFDVRGPEAGAEVWADPEHLQKVFANLLSNALKFTPEGGTVRVTVEVASGAVRVAVRDSGPGIPTADLPHVFERFYRVDESAARMQPGTGIGLALVLELVDLHGGTIAVESEEGFGSLFTVSLRRGRDHLRPEDLVEGGEGEPTVALPEIVVADLAPGGDGVSDPDPDGEDADGEDADADVTTVLVVDDNAEIRAYVRRHLTPDYRVIEAADGAEGLARARALLPDLVVSDVMMPEMDGFAFCRALKADPKTDFIPVVLLTARAEAEDRLEGLGEQADDYLTKPFDVRELRARVDNLIASRRRLRERFASGAARTGADDGLHAEAVEVDSAEAVFLERVREAVEAHLGDEDFTVERLAKAVGVSRGHFYRQLKALAGQTPSEAIRTMRLERAAQLLAAQAGTVSEVAYAVGFKSVSHFSNRFEKDFGCRPSAYPPADVPEG